MRGEKRDNRYERREIYLSACRSALVKLDIEIAGLWQPGAHSGIAFDHSMSARPITEVQKSQSAGLFTHQEGT